MSRWQDSYRYFLVQKWTHEENEVGFISELKHPVRYWWDLMGGTGGFVDLHVYSPRLGKVRFKLGKKPC